MSERGDLEMLNLWLVLFLVTGVVTAEEPPQTMTKLVVRLESREAPEQSFAAQPKVIYRAGSGYCRGEEAPDVAHGIHGLLIINEPDTWMINLFTKTGRHMLDKGPTFNCRMPMFLGREPVKSGDDLKKPLFELEFGRELAFFKGKGAAATKGPILQGKATTAYIVTVGEWQIYLFTSGSPERPVAVSRVRGDVRETFWYGAYEELPFDSKLFAKPEGVKIEEANQ
jgi:hypothetical protein